MTVYYTAPVPPGFDCGIQQYGGGAVLDDGIINGLQAPPQMGVTEMIPHPSTVEEDPLYIYDIRGTGDTVQTLLDDPCVMTYQMPCNCGVPSVPIHRDRSNSLTVCQLGRRDSLDEIPNFRTRRKSFTSVFHVPVKVFLGEQNISPFISPEFSYNDISYSVVFHPRGSSKVSDTDLEVVFQMKSYLETPENSVEFKIAMVDMEGDEQFERQTLPYYLKRRPSDYDFEELKIRKLVYRPYIECLYRNFDQIKFRTEMIYVEQLDVYAQLQNFLTWAHRMLTLDIEGAERLFKQLDDSWWQGLAAYYTAQFKMHEASMTCTYFFVHLNQWIENILNERNEKYYEIFGYPEEIEPIQAPTDNENPEY